MWLRLMGKLAVNEDAELAGGVGSEAEGFWGDV